MQATERTAAGVMMWGRRSGAVIVYAELKAIAERRLKLSRDIGDIAGRIEPTRMDDRAESDIYDGDQG